MLKFATQKQKNYLQNILLELNETLDKYTNKNLDELLHTDIVCIFDQLKTPINPCLDNIKYIIDQEFPDYIIGRQIKYNNTMKLICFTDLAIIDYDCKNGQSKESLKNELVIYLQKFPYTFLLYETFNGYHAYIVSHKMLHCKHTTINILQDLNCDPIYIGYVRKVGFVVRLNKKKIEMKNI